MEFQDFPRILGKSGRLCPGCRGEVPALAQEEVATARGPSPRPKGKEFDA